MQIANCEAEVRVFPNCELSSPRPNSHTLVMGIATVLIVEDDAFSRGLLNSTLEAANLEVVYATGQAADALVAARRTAIDVAVLDLDLGPGPTGFELALVLRREFPGLGIVFLTSYSDPRLVGVNQPKVPVGSRFLQKSEVQNPRVLISAILQAKSRPTEPQSYGFNRSSPLSDNQVRLLQLVSQGLSSKEIARELGVTEKAIEASISRLQKVLNLKPNLGSSKRISLVRAFYAITGRTPPRG